MTTPYRDKTRISSAYRAVLMGRTVGLLMLAVVLIAAAFPQINMTVFSSICLLLMLPGLLYQIHADRTLIHTGQFLKDDGAFLYVAVGTARLGFGRRYHRRKKTISAYRISRIQRVKKLRVYPFGIAVRAEVRTAVDKDGAVQDGEMLRDWLDAQGQKKTVLFRLERSLLPQDEAALLQRLADLEGAAN